MKTVNERFFDIATKSVSYKCHEKKEFHRLGVYTLKALAEELGLLEPDYEIRNNMGGIAASGEVTLHSDNLYIQLSQSSLGIRHGFYWRSCNGSRDFCGGKNQWMAWNCLLDLRGFANRIREHLEVEKAFSQGAKFAVTLPPTEGE